MDARFQCYERSLKVHSCCNYGRVPSTMQLLESILLHLLQHRTCFVTNRITCGLKWLRYQSCLMCFQLWHNLPCKIYYMVLFNVHSVVVACQTLILMWLDASLFWSKELLYSLSDLSCSLNLALIIYLDVWCNLPYV